MVHELRAATGHVRGDNLQPAFKMLARVARIMIKMLAGFRPVRLLIEGLNPRSKMSRALTVNPGTSVYLDESRVYARNLEVPAGGGVGTARAIAHVRAQLQKSHSSSSQVRLRDLAAVYRVGQ